MTFRNASLPFGNESVSSQVETKDYRIRYSQYPGGSRQNVYDSSCNTVRMRIGSHTPAVVEGKTDKIMSDTQNGTLRRRYTNSIIS